MNTYRFAALLGFAALLPLGACHDTAKPAAETTAPTLAGTPGTPSGPRPSDSALNAPAQTRPVPLTPTKMAAAQAAAAGVDSLKTGAARKAPFVPRPPLGGQLVPVAAPAASPGADH